MIVIRFVTMQKKRYAIFRENIASMMIHPTAHRAVPTVFIKKKIHRRWRNIFRENGVVCFLPLCISATKHFFEKFNLKFVARKIALNKGNENIRKSASFKDQKYRMKIKKSFVALTPKDKNATQFFRKNHKWRPTLMYIQQLAILTYL